MGTEGIVAQGMGAASPAGSDLRPTRGEAYGAFLKTLDADDPGLAAGAKLDGISLLSDLPPATVRHIEESSLWQYAPVERIVLDHRQKLDAIYFVVSGAVRIFHVTGGKQEIRFAEIPQGEAFGELSAIDGGGRSADAIAVKPTILAICPRPTFLDLVAAHPELAMKLLRKLAAIIRKADQRIVDLAALTGAQRVYLELLRLAAPHPSFPNRWIISPAPYHREIGGWAGTTTDIVARALASLMKAGLLQRSGSDLLMLDRRRIEALASAKPQPGQEDGGE